MNVLDVDLDQRRAVMAEQVGEDVPGADDGDDAGEIGADIGVAGDAHGEEPAILVEGQFAGIFVVAAMLVGKEGAGALICPVTGRPQDFAAWNMQIYSG